MIQDVSATVLCEPDLNISIRFSIHLFQGTEICPDHPWLEGQSEGDARIVEGGDMGVTGDEWT